MGDATPIRKIAGSNGVCRIHRLVGTTGHLSERNEGRSRAATLGAPSTNQQTLMNAGILREIDPPGIMCGHDAFNVESFGKDPTLRNSGRSRTGRCGNFLCRNTMSGHVLSGRALARARLGGGFPAPHFRLRGGFTVPPWAPFPAAPLKFRTSGFPGTASSIRHLAVQCAAFLSIVEVKAEPAMPPIRSYVCPALRQSRPPSVVPPLRAEPSAAPSPPEPRGRRSGRVVLSRPSSLGDLIGQSGDLRAISRTRGYRHDPWHSKGHAVRPPHRFSCFPLAASIASAASL